MALSCAFLHSAFFLLPSPPCGLGWPYLEIANSRWQMANWASILQLTAPSHGTYVQGSKFKVQGSFDVGCWMLGVGCWVLDVPVPSEVRSWPSVSATNRIYLNCRHLRRVH